MHRRAEHRRTDPGNDERLRGRGDHKIVGVVEQDAGARPISDDLPALVRMLTATTAMTLSHDSAFIGRGEDPARAVDVLERLWLNALWGARLRH